MPTVFFKFHVAKLLFDPYVVDDLVAEGSVFFFQVVEVIVEVV
jgi:hypothetical protein